VVCICIHSCDVRSVSNYLICIIFYFQAEDGIRDATVTGVQTCALPISKGRIDAAVLRREKGVPGLAFRLLVKEPLMVVLPRDHHLAAREAIRPRDLVGETFVSVSDTAPVLRAVIDDYLKRSGINITPAHEAVHLAMGMSLIASTRGLG